MRAVFVGAGTLAVMTARTLIDKGHEVVMIERDKARIDELSEHLDCGFLHGDGATPAIQREADPERSDLLFCLTENDQANIIASLVGRSLGFSRVVTRIEDPEFEHICMELGLEDTVIPDQTIARHLADMVHGQDPLEVSAMLKHGARAFSFVARDDDAGPVSELALPDRSRVICIYRKDALLLPEPDTALKPGDEVVLISHTDVMGELRERWSA